MLTLNKALNNIERTFNGLKEKDEPSPYFFIIGAGVSKPPVKLAREIIEECKKLAKELPDYVEMAFDTDMDEYSHWFEKAFDNPIDRRNYIRGLIEKKHISNANVWLAHFLSRTDVAKLVVTPNFDDFLSQALFLFREPHSICDHSATTKRIELKNPESLQIIHVHSSYRFYDTQNLTNELTATTQTSVAELLDDILRDQVPLIVGYSGWNEDVIMTAIKKRLELPVPYNFYWFCYDESALEALPEWLTKNRYVRLVAPTEIVRKRDGEMTEEERQQTEAEKQVGNALPDHPKSIDATVNHTLPADEVFLKFIQKFISNKEDHTPELFRDPLGYFLNMLNKSFESTKEIANSELQIRLKDSIRKVEKAILREKSEQARRNRRKEKWAQSKQTLPIAATLENAKEMFIKSDFSGFINLANELDLSKFNADQLSDLFERACNSSLRLSIDNNTEEELEGYDLVIKIYDSMAKIAPNRITSSENEAIVKALLSKGATLDKLKRYDGSIETYQDIENRFGSSPDLKPQVGVAMVNKGICLHFLELYDEAVEAYNAFEQKFSDIEPAPWLLEQIARAMVNKGLALATQNKHEKAIGIFKKVEDQFSDATNQPKLQELAAKAMINRAYTLSETNQFDAAMEVSKAVEQKFGTSNVPEVRKQVATAISNQGFGLLCSAKKAMSENNPSGFSYLKEAQKTIERSLEINPENPFAIGNQGYISFLLNERETAREQLSRAIQIGGEEIRQAELEDSHINELPQDGEFRELVNSIPL